MSLRCRLGPMERQMQGAREMNDLTDDVITPAVAVGVLADLRWDVDRQIINYDGEHVWLGPRINAAGVRIGITDCCFVGEECEHHAEIAAGAVPVVPDELGEVSSND